MERRTFLNNTAAISSATILSPEIVFGSKANSAIRVGIIGLGNRGTELTGYFLEQPEVEITYLCEVNRSRFAKATALVQEKRGKMPKRVADFHEVLQDDSVDAVVIATGMRWHALLTIYACQAGKDVYVEKPMSMTLFEGRKMVEAAQKYNRVVQVGSQTNSAAYFLDALNYVKSGGLGEISLVRSQIMERPIEVPQPPENSQGKPIPKGFDWDTWCGPSPLAPYWPGPWWWTKWDYNQGTINDHVAHQMAMIHSFLGPEPPKSVFCSGGVFYFEDQRDVPDSQYAVFDFENRHIVFQGSNWSTYMKTPFHTLDNVDGYGNWVRCNRVELLGTEAMMLIGRHGAGWQVYSNDDEPIAGGFGRRGDQPHVANFLDCVRTRERPNLGVEEAHEATTLCHIMNASLRVGGRKLQFDAATESFVNDEEANQLLRREGRAPWLIPESV
ncbi:MAG: NADH-dependent dehydrogenase [Cyclobacteriaceae bacterium]|nr:MAG: NADH-dependent dehydrogenase [Cyclobacteriaceae bacterium]